MLLGTKQFMKYLCNTNYNIKCEICDKIYNVSGRSINSNIKRNGHYRCHLCAVSNSKYKEALHKKFYRGGRKKYKKTKAECSLCHNESIITNGSIKRSIDKYGKYICHKCAVNLARKEGKYDHIKVDIEMLKRNSEKFWNENRGKWKERIVTDEFRRKVSCGVKKSREKISRNNIKLWKNDKYF